MSDLPDLGVMIFTYDRYETAERTLRALLEHLHYSGVLRVHIADDGSPAPAGAAEDASYAEMLRVIAEASSRVLTATASNAGQHGYGASYNLATQVLHPTCEVLIPIEDDWELRAPLDCDPLVETLLDPTLSIDCIRLGYIGFTQELRATFVHSPASMMLLLDPESPEPHVFAGHVRIETRDFERRVGPWPEMLPAGQTEWEVSQRPEARRGVAWPADVLRPSEHRFAHIGVDAKNLHEPTGVAASA